MAIITEHLQLNKQFLIIDSPVPFTLVANNGTDEVYRMAGAWQIDTHKLLPEKYQKQYPVFNLDLVYDDTNLGGQIVTVRESNIDIGDGISGVNGQDVRVTNYPLNQRITNELDSSDNKIPLKVELDTPLDLTSVAQETTLQDIYNFLPNLKKKIYSIKGTKSQLYNYLVNNFSDKLQEITLYDDTVKMGFYCDLIYAEDIDGNGKSIWNCIVFQSSSVKNGIVKGIVLDNNKIYLLLFSGTYYDKPYAQEYTNSNSKALILEY